MKIEITKADGGIVRDELDADFKLDSPADIVLALGRICRYAGQVPFSVLSHSMLTGGIAASMYRLVKLASWEANDFLFMAQLWAYGFVHDLHEVYLGDCVWIDKPDWVRNLTDQIDKRVWDTCGLPVPSDGMKKAIKASDMLARYIEVQGVAHDEFIKGFAACGVAGPGTAWAKPERSIEELGVLFLRTGYAKFDRTALGTRNPKTWTPAISDCVKWLECMFTGDFLLPFNSFMRRVWFKKHPIFAGLRFEAPQKIHDGKQKSGYNAW